MVGHRSLLLERRECCAHRGEVRLLLQDIGASLATQLELALNDLELLVFNRDDFTCRCNLIAHRGQLNRRRQPRSMSASDSSLPV